MNKIADGRFPLLLGIINSYGYLCATLPPAILDPLLTTHVRFHSRIYPHSWLIFPVSLLVFLTTWLAFVFLPRQLRSALGGAPLLIAGVFSNVFIFPTELPHINIVFVMAMWLVITMLWAWIHYSRSELTADQLNSDIAIEFLRERANFYRSTIFGLVAAFLALLVGTVVSLNTHANQMVDTPEEVFMLHQLDSISIANYALLFFFGPVLESLKAWEQVANLFLALKGKSKSSK